MLFAVAVVWLGFVLFLFLFFCGTGDGTQGHSTSKLYPQPILFFILKQGLTMLQRASQVAEAGLEPAILLSQPPEYWDDKCVPPRPAEV